MSRCEEASRPDLLDSLEEVALLLLEAVVEQLEHVATHTGWTDKVRSCLYCRMASLWARSTIRTDSDLGHLVFVPILRLPIELLLLVRLLRVARYDLILPSLLVCFVGRGKNCWWIYC